MSNPLFRDPHARIEELQADIERLTAALSVAGLWRDMGEENERLKAALRGVIYEYGISANATIMRDIARAALEGET